MRQDGELHEWMDIFLPPYGETLTICKKTGYIPSKSSYYDLDALSYLLVKQECEELSKNLQNKFLDLLLSEMADKYQMNVDVLKNIELELSQIHEESLAMALEDTEFKDKQAEYDRVGAVLLEKYTK